MIENKDQEDKLVSYFDDIMILLRAPSDTIRYGYPAVPPAKRLTPWLLYSKRS